MVENLKYWVWLSSIQKITPKKCNQLIDLFGDPENIWYAKEEELKRVPFLNEAAVKLLTDTQIRDEVKKHLEDIQRYHIDVITIGDRLYPQYLKNIFDPPIVIYSKGHIKNDDKTVAVVGSRNATLYGLSTAEAISRELAGCGITVVSGMARGIDSYAHNGALKAGGRTIAVLGCGLDIVYPYENRELMARIMDSGAVISEYLPGVPPLPYNFPARNRIISGISLGVVVIEAGERSGSLITADFALEQGREVFAVPGNVSSENSKGTNRLIRDGAKIVTEIEDILEELKVFKSNNNKCFVGKNILKRALLNGLDNEERKVAECLMNEPLHIDMLVKNSGLNIQTVNSILVMMELKGLVEQMPGKIFKLKE